MPTYLLDKNVARRIIQALNDLDNMFLEQELALKIWQRLVKDNHHIFITYSAVNIILHFSYIPAVQCFLKTVEPIKKGRYLKRWASRIRKYNFTREDAIILALGTYGTNARNDMLGVDIIITLDKPFSRNFETHYLTLETRLIAMTKQLKLPYRLATLPDMIHPKDME
ncbi:MAG: hypothetical protein B6242_05465 [Anaerolineaceae bacterium 4572_78]|nr:MAG: hypothetical protein B6242_05465 [Anaerolineaceae bacterium 4572_78]